MRGLIVCIVSGLCTAGWSGFGVLAVKVCTCFRFFLIFPLGLSQ